MNLGNGRLMCHRPSSIVHSQMFRHRFSQIRPLAVVIDALFLILAYSGSIWLRREVLILFLAEEFNQGWRDWLLNFFYKGYSFTSLQGEPPLVFDFGLLLLMGGIWLFLLNAKGAYDDQVLNSLERQWKAVFNASLWGGLILILLGFTFVYRQAFLPRTQVVLFLPLVFGLLLFGRGILYQFMRWRHEKGWDRKTVLVVGVGQIAGDLIDQVENHPEWGLDVLGFVEIKNGSNDNLKPVLGTIEHLCDLLHRHPVDAVIFAVSMHELEFLNEALELCELEGVETHIASDFFRRMIARLEMDDIHGLNVLTLSTTRYKEWHLFVKRIMDILGSSTALIIASPVLTVIVFLIKLTSPGPIFYRWNVLGLNKKPFTGYKFRTMVVNADHIKDQLWNKNEMTGPVFKIKDDPRITPIGRFLRKFSIDEFTQLYSVLKGDMSLVGPRPGGITEVPKYENWHRRKLSVKPGITCLWQVRGRNQITDFNEWVRMDLEYIDNWSLWLDLKILLKTIPVVLCGKGAS